MNRVLCALQGCLSRFNPRPGRPAGASPALTRLATRLALALMLALGLGTPAAAVTLVAKFSGGSSETTTPFSTEVYRIAQGFITGDNTQGYDLEKITMRGNFKSGTTVEADLYAGFGQVPGTWIADLTFSNIGDLTVNEAGTPEDIIFTPPANTILNPRATYFIVVKQTADNISFFADANDDAMLEGETDWSVLSSGHTQSGMGSDWEKKVVLRHGSGTPMISFRIKVEGEIRTAAIPALVGNFGQTASTGLSLSTPTDYAQEFTTGTNAGGYALSHVAIGFAGDTYGVPGFGIYTEESNAPGTEVVALTGNSVSNGGINYFYPETATTLSPNTDYFLLIEWSAMSSVVVATSSDAEDSGASAGWSINNDILARTSGSTPGSWSADAGGRSAKIAIRGREKSPPTSANNTVTVDISGATYDPANDDPYTFSADDFSFADTDPGDSLAGIKIVRVETAGDLTLNGNPVTTGQYVPLDEIGNLVFTPATGGQGTGYSTFTFRVNDGIADSPVYTMAVNLESITTITRIVVTSTPAAVDSDGGRFYGSGETIEITAVFDEPVTVSGSPEFTFHVENPDTTSLDTDTNDLTAAFAGGSGTNRLRFRYTFGESDKNILDGIFIGADALDLNGGTIQNSDNENAILTHDAPGVQPGHRVNIDISSRAIIRTVAVTSEAGGDNTYRLGDHIDITATFSEPVHVTGRPSIELQLGTSNVSAFYLSGSGTNALVFRYTVMSGNKDDDGISIGERVFFLNGGTIRDADGIDASLDYTAPGIQSNHKVDASSAATVTGISVISTGSKFDDDGDRVYGEGDHIEFEVRFTEPVEFFANPGSDSSCTAACYGFEFNMANDGDSTGVDKRAAYHAGSGTKRLRFRYEVQSGDEDDNGIRIDENPVDIVSGYELRSVAGNTEADTDHDPTRFHADHKVDGSLADRPKITGIEVTSEPETSTAIISEYRLGEGIEFTVTFDEEIFVTGAPAFTFFMGSASVVALSRSATYAGKSARNKLTFVYIVQSGDVDKNGIFIGDNPVTGGTIRDADGNNADRSISRRGTQADHKVDGSISISDSVTWPRYVGTELLPDGLGPGDRFRLLFVSNGRRAPNSDKILDYNDFVQGEADGGHSAIQDYSRGFRVLGCTSAVNARVNTDTESSDTDAPIYWLGGDKVADDYADLYDGGWDSNTPRNEDGGILSGINGDVTTGCNSNGTPSSRPLGNSGLVSTGASKRQGQELFRNDLNIQRNQDSKYYGLSPVFKVLASDVPEISRIAVTSDPGSDETYGADDDIEITVTFDESVTVTGTPTFGIKFSADITALAEYDSGESSGSEVVFRYTVQPGDRDDSGIFIDSDALDLNGGTIRDLDDNNAILKHLRPQVRSYSGHRVDATTSAPQAVEVDLVSSPADENTDTYRRGEHIEINVSFTAPVNVMLGEPKIQFLLGDDTDNTRDAVYVRGTGTENLVFRYTVQTTDLDIFGIRLLADAIDPNGATIQDAGGQTATLTGYTADTRTGGLSGHKVNGAPYITDIVVSSEPKSGDDTYIAGEDIEFSVYFDQPVLAPDLPRFEFRMGNSGGDIRTVAAAYVSGSGSNLFIFRYRVLPSDEDDNGIFIEADPVELGTMMSLSAEDSEGVDAVRDFGQLGGQSKHKVDGGAPRIDQISISSAPDSGDTYEQGEVIEIGIRFDNVVTVDTADGNPVVRFTIGSIEHTAQYASRTVDGTNFRTTLSFQYTVRPGDIDTDGISVGANAIDLNGGTIRGGSSTATVFDAVLSHAALPTQSGHKVDGGDIDPPVFQGAAIDGKIVELTYSEPLDETDDGIAPADAFTVTVGDNERDVTSVSVDGSTVQLRLSEAVVMGDAVTVAYTAPGTAPHIRDLNTNPAGSLDPAETVTNNAPACPDTTNHPGDALWTACLTLGQASGRVGYGQVNSYGALDPSSFTEGNDFVVTQLSQNTSMFYLALATSDLAVTEDWVLQVGDTTLNLADATLTHSLFSWTRPAALNWDSATTVNNPNVGNKISVSLTQVTLPPVRDSEVTAIEDEDYVFSVSDFRYSAPDGGGFDSIRIVNVETAGDLELDGTDVEVNDVISVARITAGDLVFTPEADGNGIGYATFTYSISDDGTDSETVTMTIHVASVPEIESIEVTSTPLGRSDPMGAPDTYGVGAEIEVTVTFDEPVVVNNASLFIFVEIQGGAERRVLLDYDTGSGSAVITFTQVFGVNTVYDDNDGIRIKENPVFIGSTVSITSLASGLDADGAFPALGELPDHKVSSSVDYIQPTVSRTPVVTAAAPKELVITFTEALDTTSIPAASAFTVKVDGMAEGTPTGVSISGSTVTLTLATALDDSQTNVTVDYGKPASNPLKDTADNEVENFTDVAVTNNAPACGPGAAGHPGNAYWKACLTVGENAAFNSRLGYGQSPFSAGALDPDNFTVGGEQFDVRELFQAGNTQAGTITFDLTLSTSTPSAAGSWFLQVGDTTLNLEDADLTGGTFRWTAPFGFVWDDDNIGDKVTVSLTPPDSTAPTVTGAEVTAAAPKELAITFDEELDAGSVPDATAFTVRAGGSDGPTPTDVGISGAVVTLTFATAFDAGQTPVMVDYANPGAGNRPLQDAAGNDVADFTEAVTISVPACPDTASHPANAYWTACLTVGRSVTIGEIRLGYAGSPFDAGVLDPDNFTVGDQQFDVLQLFQVNSTKLNLILETSDLAVTADWVFQVGDTMLNFTGADLTGRVFQWTLPGAGIWDDDNIGDKVTVSLTLPDVTAPTVTGAEVAADAPDVMVLTFDEALDTGSVPAADAFTVRVDGSDGPDVMAVAIDSTDATQVRLTLATAVDAAQTSVTVDYTNPGMANDPLRDIVGNEVETFIGQTVVSASSSGLVFTPETVTVAEGGQARYTVALDAAPVADVIVSIVSDDEGAATVSPATLTFTPTDWDSAQEVTVTGVDDGVDGDDRTVTITHSGTGVETGTVSVTVTAESILEAPRREEATVLLRRHVDRFASVSSEAALGRLQGLAPPTTVNAQISARSHKLDASWTDDRAKDSGWAGWSRLFYGWVEGPGDGTVYDLYLGVDWRAPDGRYVIGGLLGHEGADLRLDDGGGRFRSRITQVGVYGATYLSDALILDGALAYGFGRPELSMVEGGNEVRAKYDTKRFTIRADLTGGISWSEGAVVVEPQVGVLHVQEKLGAFTDSTGAPGAAETLRLTRLGVGPRLTWALPNGVFTGRARLNWDRHNLEGDGDKVSDLSASLDARLRYDLEGGLSAEFFGAADGIGLSGDQQTYTAGVSLNFRF